MTFSHRDMRLPDHIASARATYLVIFGFLVLSLVFCRRFFNLTDPNSHAMMDGDPALNAWVLDWVTHAMTRSPAAILDGNAFFPYPRSIALAEHMLSLAMINVFVSPFGSNPWFGYNVLIFLSDRGSADSCLYANGQDRSGQGSGPGCSGRSCFFVFIT